MSIDHCQPFSTDRVKKGRLSHVERKSIDGIVGIKSKLAHEGHNLRAKQVLNGTPADWVRSGRTMNATENLLTASCVEAHREEIYRLELWRFTVIEPEAAAVLSPLRKYLNLSGVLAISQESAEAFSNHYGVLDLSGLTDISESVALALARAKGGLWLNGLRTLNVPVASALATHHGNLYLRGVTELSEEAATALAEHAHFLSLGGLVRTPEVAKALAKHRGYGL